ncbi:hypothetical protein DFJ73DRAFT_809573 [Zopfochytrium polystomum]|nr:hypothetical protein DFJ73DRAFT_809573 [Zopfochytrium polystomum]
MSSAMASDDVVFSENMEAHRLRQLEKEKIHGYVLQEGVTMGTIVGSTFLGASLLAQKFLPAYRSLTFPFKVFIVSSAVMGGFFTGTDRAAMKADRAFAMRFSVTHEDELSLIKESREARNWESLRRTLYKNRFEILAASYFGILGTTLAYNFARKDIFTSQKFINARMTAQVAAIAGVGAVAVLASSTPRETVVDPYYERVLREPSTPTSK